MLSICRFPWWTREAIYYVGRSRTELPLKSLAEALGVDATCVSRSISRVERTIVQDKARKPDVDRIVVLIENSKYHACLLMGDPEQLTRRIAGRPGH